MAEIIKDIQVLGKRADEIDIKKNNAEARKIVIELKNTIRENDLKSLSAPQIGYNKRIFVLNFSGDLRSFVDPIITKRTGITISKETCSSIDGKTYIIPRNSQVEVMYFTPLGQIETRKFIGLAAQIMQHQIDHLDGILVSDIGQQLPENYQEFTQEEKEKFIKDYLDGLDIKQKNLEKEIQSNDDLKEMSDAITFLQEVKKGNVKIVKDPIKYVDESKQNEQSIQSKENE